MEILSPCSCSPLHNPIHIFVYVFELGLTPPSFTHTFIHFQITMQTNPTIHRPSFHWIVFFLIPQAMVETVNNLLQPQAQAAWRELSTGDQLRAATMLLDTVEQGAFVLADNLLKTDIVQENTENIREYKLEKNLNFT